jgi:hypothetical protein
MTNPALGTRSCPIDETKAGPPIASAIETIILNYDPVVDRRSTFA